MDFSSAKIIRRDFFVSNVENVSIVKYYLHFEHYVSLNIKYLCVTKSNIASLFEQDSLEIERRQKHFRNLVPEELFILEGFQFEDYRSHLRCCDLKLTERPANESRLGRSGTPDMWK